MKEQILIQSNWASNKLKVPVIDHWWQTETGFPMVGCPQGLNSPPVKIGTAGLAMPGYDVKVLDEDGTELLKLMNWDQ